MKSLCLDKLPTGWEAELDRWRTSVHTVGRCFTDCRQRCSPNQNLAGENGKKKTLTLFLTALSHTVNQRKTLAILATCLAKCCYWQQLVSFDRLEAGVRLWYHSPVPMLWIYSTSHVHIYLKIEEMDLLQLLKPRYDALHIVVNGLFNVIQHGLI